MTDGTRSVAAGKSRSSALDRLTLLLLGLTIFMALCFGIIFIAPGVFFNPFPPYDVALMTIAPTLTPVPTFPATWTPTPAQTIRPSPTRPSLTPTPTHTLRPTRTPIPTDTPTPSITPTPTEDVCKTLKLLGPPPATHYNEFDPVSVVWTFGRPLTADEHFDVLLNPPKGSMGSIGWADNADPKNKNCTTFCEFQFGVFGVYSGGRFEWTIGVIRTNKEGKVTAQVCQPPDPYFFTH